MNESDAYSLREPVPAEPFLPDPALPWWAWVAIGLAVAGVATAVVLLVRHRRDRSPTIDVAGLRRRALEALEAIDPAGRPAGVATAVSLLLRRFLGDSLGDPALFETHEEFLARNHSLDGLPAGECEDVRRHFATLARLKYGPEAPADTAALLDDARKLLEGLHPQPPPPPEPPPEPTPAGRRPALPPPLPHHASRRSHT